MYICVVFRTKVQDLRWFVTGSSDGEQILSDDDADVLTVSSSVSGTPQSAAVVAPPPRVGVPGSLEPSQLISSLEAFHNDDASLADFLFS